MKLSAVGTVGGALALVFFFLACFELPDPGLRIRNRIRSEVAILHALAGELKKLEEVSRESLAPVFNVYDRDVWERDYLVKVEGESVTVFSKGPDGHLGTADDCVLRYDHATKQAWVDSPL